MQPKARVLLLSSIVLGGFLTGSVASAKERPVYRSPNQLAIAPNGKTLYAGDQTARVVVMLDVAGKSKRSEIALAGRPEGLCLSPDGGTLYVAEHGGGSVAIVDTGKGAVTGRIAVDRWPVALALAPKSNRLYVGNEDTHRVAVVDLATNQVVSHIPVIREPSAIAVSPDGKTVVVNNLFPLGPGIDPTLAAMVSIIDAQKNAVVAHVKLPPGSSLLNDVCVSPDGKWAYVVHGLGRFNLPITQLERGWVSTFALSVIDVAKKTALVTMLLDDLTQGAADPYGIVCSADGSQLWISHAGVHEISEVKIGLVHQLLAGSIPGPLAQLRDGSLPNIWVRIQNDRSLIAELANDLTALYIADAIRRLPSGGIGPRGVVLSPDTKALYVANYYTGSVAVLGTADNRMQGAIALGPQPEADSIRRGEIIFHDATRAFQRWHSCASCHAHEGRVDGLRWDFLSDGIGNAKDTLSLVHFDRTEPLNRRATAADARSRIHSGLETAYMLVPTERDVDDVFAFLSSLRPVPSPHLTADGKLTELALRGKTIFEGKANCAGCHPAPHFTDRKMHNVGVLSENEPDGRYDTPSLLELWRTAPYLHDGRAVAIKDMLTTHNPNDQHGKIKTLAPHELDALITYLQSL